MTIIVLIVVMVKQENGKRFNNCTCPKWSMVCKYCVLRISLVNVTRGAR